VSVYERNFLFFDNGQFTFRKQPKIAMGIKHAAFRFAFISRDAVDLGR